MRRRVLLPVLLWQILTTVAAWMPSKASARAFTTNGLISQRQQLCKPLFLVPDDDEEDNDDHREFVYVRRQRGRQDRREDEMEGEEETRGRYYDDFEDDYNDDDDLEVDDWGDFDDETDEFDEVDDDDFQERLWSDVLIPNPLLDNMDPDGAAERFPELARDGRFWFDMLLFVAFLDFVSFAGPRNPYPGIGWF
jgi:hypothetical protein